VPKDRYELAVLAGDGIGPEVVAAALSVLERVAEDDDLTFHYEHHRVGAALYLDTGEGISPTTMDTVGRADAVLFGAAGLPDVRRPDGTEVSPQIDIRERFGLFASLRPAKLYPGVPTNLRVDAVDLVVVRETTEGMFAGRHDPVQSSDETVSDRMTITRATSEQLFELAFALASSRRQTSGTPGHVTLLDKSNVLPSNAFFRKIFDEVALRHPDIGVARRYIDAGAMLLVTDPGAFDVIVTENLFGDIASDIAAGIVGGLGVAPSADVSATTGVFQPCHGSAPDIAGQGIANPVAAMLSVAMLLEWLAERHDDSRCLRAAARMRAAVADVLATGPKTPDLGGSASTDAVTAAVIAALRHPTSALR
jgi:3-isopropylmalate dehydrogenase